MTVEPFPHLPYDISDTLTAARRDLGAENLVYAGEPNPIPFTFQPLDPPIVDQHHHTKRARKRRHHRRRSADRRKTPRYRMDDYLPGLMRSFRHVQRDFSRWEDVRGEDAVTKWKRVMTKGQRWFYLSTFALIVMVAVGTLACLMGVGREKPQA